MNISNAIKAIDGIKSKPEYANLRIAHGKDRCANPPRSGPQNGSGARRGASGNGANIGEPTSAIDENIDGDDEVVDFLNGDLDHVEVMHVDTPHQTNGIPV
jgi:hypothetical protein